ncbi:MAG: sodium:proton exchanger, partial [Phycisphaerales bacterium]|nr:sodium:proton exchanger [Phycisphaerales bacterium]
AERLRQTAVLGYLVAGTVVGPGVLGWVHGGESIDALAELGAATLLFSIGTEFSVARLRALGARTFVAGVLQVAATMGAAMALCMGLGLGTRSAFAVGAIVSLSSTAVVMRLLIEQRSLDSSHGRLSLGVLLTQDLAVVPLVIAVTIAAGGSTPDGPVTQLARAAGGAVLLVTGFLLLVRLVFPRIMRGAAMVRNRELIALFATVCAVGSALGAEAVGLSAALGAFVAGVLLGSSPFAAQVRAEVAPLKTLLLTLFFAAVGLAGDPGWAWANAGMVSGAVAAIVCGKALVAALVCRAVGMPSPVALAAGLCLAQIGEFSFVIAEVARAGGLLDGTAHRLVVTATIGSLALSPFLVSAARRIARMRPPPGAMRSGDADAAAGAPRVVLVGYGPAGRRAFERLRALGCGQVDVIESNPALAAVAVTDGARTHVGDAGRLDVLEHVGIRGADVVAVTTADLDAVRHVTALVRSIAPRARIVARARYAATVQDMAVAGADRVVDEESIVGERIADDVAPMLRAAPAR